MSGSPFTFNVVDLRMPTLRGDGLKHGVEDKPTLFYVYAQSAGDLDVKIEGPNHFTKHKVERQQNSDEPSNFSFAVKYTPVEVGTYKIFVKWNDKDLLGSPFAAYVSNPEKVKCVGG